MKPFLILGHPLDLHAHYVAWALGTAGHRTTFINSSHDNCPTHTTLYIDKDCDDFTSADWDADAVWFRRLSSFPAVGKNDGDHDEFTLGEERRFTKWFIGMQENRPIRWINPPPAAQAAENKFVQLKLARSCGIDIPRTLVTAQPDRFRTFLRTEGVVVAKALDGYSWKQESGETLSAFASVLDVERGSQLSDESIAQCVTMYQERIDKVADVRMIVMGADVFAYKVTQDGEQHFDFRIGFYHENHLKYEAIQVLASLKKKMINLMGSLRINFASADFALKADGEWVFLDLNPNGQWLFVEAACPESRVGQKFCSFFVNARVDARGESLFPSFADYMESYASKSLRDALRKRSVA
jgi:glutathione synthase/RimK-type ligase-like ATP-grasp enzyme